MEDTEITVRKPTEIPDYTRRADFLVDRSVDGSIIRQVFESQPQQAGSD